MAISANRISWSADFFGQIDSHSSNIHDGLSSSFGWSEHHHLLHLMPFGAGESILFARGHIEVFVFYSVRVAILFVIASLVSACGTTNNIRSGSALDLVDDSGVLVIGLNPKYRIHFTRGPIDGNVWARPTFDIPEINVTPDNGYVIVKVKATTPTEVLGVSLIFPNDRTYGPCQDTISPTFVVKAGAVNYAGDLRYEFDGTQLRWSHTLDEEKVSAYLKTNFPGYAERLVVQPMMPIKTKTNLCGPKTITIPIFLPSRK